MRSLVLLAMLLMSISGALMQPVPVLTLSDGRTQTTVRLEETQAYTYSYLNSIYLSPVMERHQVVDGQIRITGVESTDIRAVEYFRWEGEIRQTGQVYAQVAPFWEATRLTIRVVSPYQQRFSGDGWSLNLEEVFGEGVVEVTPGHLPFLLAVVRGART